MRTADADGPINWNNSTLPLFGGIDSSRVQADVNDVEAARCDGEGTFHRGFDDSDNLQYDFRASPDFADGVHTTAYDVDDELSRDLPAATEDQDLDGVVDLDDNCLYRPNPGQEDACENDPPGPIAQVPPIDPGENSPPPGGPGPGPAAPGTPTEPGASPSPTSPTAS
jgi:hypothetical protein